VTVAQLKYRYKGHDVVARALPIIAAAVPGVEWVIVGDGPLRPYLEALVRANGVADGVRFVGSVADVERDSWLRRADVMVMPSRIPAYGVGGEGFGIAYSEASARGVPVVAGDVGGARDAVADGITGLLVDPTDHLAVADAVTKLLGDAELRRRMGEAGRRRARELEWPRVARRVEEVLVRLAELGRGSESPLSDDLAFHR
jgi:phosphatidylinositol alpha-1,6-mannosyltransferase